MYAWSLPPDSALTARDQQRPFHWGAQRWPPWPWDINTKDASQARTFYITDLPGKPDDFSRLLGLGCAHLCQSKLGGCCHAEVLPHSRPLQELLRTPSDNTEQRKTWSHLILLLDQVTAPRCLGGLTLGSQPDWPPWEVPWGSEDKLHTLKWETNPHEGSSLPLLVSIYFSTCLMQFFFFSLYLLHCCDLLAIIWFLYGKKSFVIEISILFF